LALAHAGADVVITDILLESDASAAEANRYGPLNQRMQANRVVYAEQTAEEIRRMGRRALVCKMDVTNKRQVEDVCRKVKDEMGGIHILVNNAAILDHVSRIEFQSDEFWERDLRVNLTGAYNTTKAVWPIMKEQRWGRIINMASVAGTMGGFGQASYSATKSGILGFTKSMALEGAKYNITVNAVVPGIINTEAFQTTDPSMRERMIQRTAFKRPGEPEDIANAVCFLASDHAKYITGIELNVSGGIELFTY
jgi:3-oxoacyl-[acyl-carrier protein] reductase